MGNLFYQPEQAWVGDLIPYYDNGKYYAFYLHDPRIFDDKYAEDTTWHLVTTDDFINVEYKGEAIKRGGVNDFNKNIYTGSVIKDNEGLYHAFYTAFNEDKKLNGDMAVQTVMKAVGYDLEHLETVEDFLFASDGLIYEEFDWRDPFVFWVAEESCYYMIMASRTKGAGELRGGCISLSKSTDLIHWTHEQPFYEPHMYITMECPEVFQMGEYWYLIFSTFSDRFTTHYRYAKDLNGPWLIPEDDVFDTRANYAIKTASDGDKRFAFGWVASKKGETDFGAWDWGGTMIFHEIIQEKNSPILRVIPVPKLKDYYSKVMYPEQFTRFNNHSKQINGITSETLGASLIESPYEDFSLQIKLTINASSEFGIALHTDPGLEKGYFLRMYPHQEMMAWDFWPRGEKGPFQWQIKGDVPYQVETARALPDIEQLEILVIKEKDICVVYVNDQVALSTRMYNHKGGYLGAYVIQGELLIDDLVLKTKK